MTCRWMSEISYNNGASPKEVAFEELAELHDIVELGPDWNTIDQIIVRLNRPGLTSDSLAGADCKALADAVGPS